VTNEIWRSDNKNASDVMIISNTGLDSMTTTLAATITTAAMSTVIESGIATIDLRLRVNHQPVIKGKGLVALRQLLKLKHNQIKSNDFN
jgi:hypothetical protein